MMELGTDVHDPLEIHLSKFGVCSIFPHKQSVPNTLVTALCLVQILAC